MPNMKLKYLYQFFAALLAENGRLKNLSSIINNFKTIMAAHRGDLNIEVTVAQVNYTIFQINVCAMTIFCECIIVLMGSSF